jgi:hypothetical protein
LRASRPGDILPADAAYDSDALRRSLGQRGAWGNIQPFKEGKNPMKMYDVELCGRSAGKLEPAIRLTINVMAENNRQAIECAKDRLVSVGVQNNANMVRVRDNGGSIIWEGR